MEATTKQVTMSYAELVSCIQQVHSEMRNHAKTAINSTQTVRNWLIGCYVVEYEQHGSDRAKYGDNLLAQLEKSINTRGINVTLLQLSRLFYIKYPQVGAKLSSIYATLSHKLPINLNEQIYATLSHNMLELPQKDELEAFINRYK